MNNTCSLEAPSKRRKLCSMGSGEVMHILSYKALDDKIEEFETVVQEMARLLYSLESEITDVRVCHPKCGEVCFVLTFITREAMTKFQEHSTRKVSLFAGVFGPNDFYRSYWYGEFSLRR